MSYVLAIDVGTSFTAAALVKPCQGPTPTPEILSLGLHGSAVPSVLFYAGDGRVLVGEAAERRGLDDPQRMVREFKRRIGDSVPLAVGESWLAPEDVYATMARWVVDKAQEREGTAPTSIIMTHPAAWGQHRTSLVLAALTMAGLQDITLISEPEAAALHYASQTRVEDGSIIAVYDLGGGTFDTAILRKAGAGNFELLGRPDGIETLGGADFDAAVLRHVMGHLGDGPAMDPASPETLAALARLRRECREAKEALSLDSEASVAVSLPGTQTSVRLVRSEFEAMIEAPVRDTVDALQRSLRTINLQAQDLSAVLLIGGSSRIPLVAELISVELDRPIAVDADPKSSICRGAAVAGLLSQGADAVDAAAASATAASAPAAAALPSGPVKTSAAAAMRRPHVPGRAPAFNHPKSSVTTPGRHAPRPRVRMAAAAAAAAAALTIATATAAQSPEGSGLLATMFGNQAADVMRDGGAQAAGAQATGAQGNGAGGAGASVPVVGGLAGGLEASARAGVTRAGSNGKAPAKGANTQGTNPGSTSAGTGGTGSAGSGSGTTAGTGTGAAGTTPPVAPGASTPPAAPAPGTQTPGTPAPGTQAPGTQTPPATPAPDPTGGAASGPTPPPTTTPPTTEPTTPPVTEPTTPPSTPADPVTPPPTPEPTVPAPEPTVVQDPPPPAQEPILPQETTPPAVPDPAPLPTETSPAADPALLSAV